MDAEEIQAPTACETLNRLLREVRLRSNKKWMLQERVRTVRMFMREPTTTRSYDLYVRNSMIHVWSQIQFYKECNEENDCSVSGSIMAAYLYGVLAGLKDKETGLDKRIGGIC